MSLSVGQLNRATLGRRLLLRREPLDVVAAAGRVVALQAQEAASPYHSPSALRSSGFPQRGLSAPAEA